MPNVIHSTAVVGDQVQIGEMSPLGLMRSLMVRLS